MVWRMTSSNGSEVYSKQPCAALFKGRDVYAEPIITVYGSGDITLMVGMTIIQLEGIKDSITLDSTLMEAYKGATSLNSSMSGEFPLLQPGANAVSWSGNVTSVVVMPNWRFL